MPPSPGGMIPCTFHVFLQGRTAEPAISCSQPARQEPSTTPPAARRRGGPVLGHDSILRLSQSAPHGPAVHTAG